MSDETIRLTLPATPRYGRVARTAAKGLALRLGYSYREIEDLCLALDEALILLLRPDSDDGTLTIVFDPTGEDLVVDAEVTTGLTGAGADDEARSRFKTLVDPVVDSWEIDDAGVAVHLVKHRLTD
jgi:hypothetical protein